MLMRRMRMESRIASYIQLSLREVLKTRMNCLIEEEERKIAQSKNKPSNSGVSSFVSEYPSSFSHTNNSKDDVDLLALQQQPQLIATKLLLRYFCF